MQAHAERLASEFAGRELSAFEPLSFTALKTYSPAPERAVGHPLEAVGRRGKYLLLHFDDITFVLHLMQGGRLRPGEGKVARPRGGLARWSFSDGAALIFTEAAKQRRAGVWVVAGDPGLQPPLDSLGPDADSLTLDDLRARIAERSMRLHGFLRNQKAIAGVGRRLANEICHRARLSPFANTAKLRDDDTARLLDAIGSCIAESLAYERGRDDMSSSKERPGEVHHRTGEACPVCGDTVRAIEYSGYTVNYCASCQTRGKVLADNTTSKFLR